MKGTVTKLCGFESVKLPEDILTATVDGAKVDAEVETLALRYATLTEASTVEVGDVVYCSCNAFSDGRTVLIYTAMNIPGAEKASSDVLGKNIKDCVKTVLCGKDVSLTVEKIVRPVPATVDDKLIAGIGIEGVSTVEEYREYSREKMLSDILAEKRKLAMFEVVSQLVAGSEIEIDEAEVDGYLAENREAIAEDYRAGDMPMPSDDELRENIAEQYKQGLFAEEFCRRNGIEVDREAAETEADQMIEMMTLMGEKVPSRDEMVEEAVRNFCVMELYGRIDEFLTEKAGR